MRSASLLTIHRTFQEDTVATLRSNHPRDCSRKTSPYVQWTGGKIRAFPKFCTVPVPDASILPRSEEPREDVSAMVGFLYSQLQPDLLLRRSSPFFRCQASRRCDVAMTLRLAGAGSARTHVAQCESIDQSTPTDVTRGRFKSTCTSIQCKDHRCSDCPFS